MDSGVNQRDSLQNQIQASRASSSSTASSMNFSFERPEQINDHVYQVHKPAGLASVEIVFFHGLQLEGSKDAYLTTWLSAEGSELWLTWILEHFKNARILLVSYDAFAQRKDEQGLMDMYVTCENLVQDLTDGKAKVGGDGCPVILVGHSIGGLVMKALCVMLESTISKLLPHNRIESLQALLHNVKGLFYYACPHHGSRLADSSTDFPKGPFFEGMTTLNKEAERRNEDFRKLCLKYRWKTYGIQEGRPTTLGQFKDFIVAEASARGDVDGFYTCDANHFDVCRPKCTSSSNFIKLSNFVGDVLQQDQDRRCPKLWTPEGIYGLEGRVNDITKKLYEGARRLGIVGMGGIGKTTLAEAVYYTISKSFDYTCFLKDLKKIMAKKDNQEYLQKKIRKTLLYKGCKVSDSFNWETLKEKKVLIVLDDVDHASQVQVMLKADGFLEESCVIVTSRESGFLHAEKFEIYFMEKLDKEDSKRVFCLHAFRKEVAEPGYYYCMEQFLKRCEGLPLALRVAGKYLYGQERSVWKDGLEKLKHAKPLNGSKEDGLWSILRVCFESLAEDEQEMFLDVSTCFHNQDLETVKRSWSLCSWASPDAGLKNLIDKGLVTIEENVLSRQGPIIRMHEVLRDLGRRMACPDIENVATHTRLCYDLSNPQSMTQLFNEEKPQVKVLVINRFEDIKIQSLHRLEELRILWLEDVSLRGPLNLLPTKLAYMKMTDSRLSDQLEGAHSRFTKASAQRKKKRKTSGQPSALKQLEIHDCTLSEGNLDSLGQCHALEHLEISSVSNWTALPKSLGQLGALKYLRVASCDQLESIPHSLGNLQALKYLVIQDCQRMKAMPKSLGQLQGLEHLEVSCGCSKAPSSTVRQLRNLRHLGTTLCKERKGLLDWLGKLKDLQKLVIHGCIDHGFLSTADQLDFLESLRRSSLLQGVGQVDLPVFHGKTIEIIAWDSEHLPSHLFHLVEYPSSLRIKSCRNLKALPYILGKLEGLKELYVEDCNHLEALPDTLGDLRALHKLTITSCGDLKSLPGSLGKLEALESLDIHNCNSLDVLPHSLGELRALHKLTITSCGDLKSLPGSLGKLEALESLDIHNCNSLDVLPHSLGELRALRQLTIKSCLSLKSLPDALGKLKALEFFCIEGCNSLEALPYTFGELRALLQFTIKLSWSLKSLSDAFGKLEALEYLNIESCNSLESLPYTFGELRALSQLTIKSCGSLKSLPDALGKLEALENLYVEDCKSLEVLPHSLGELGSLRCFWVRFCGHLKSLPDALGKLEALEVLVIEDCSSLEVLPGSIGELRALREFTIMSCGHLKSLPDALGKLEALENLYVEDCKSLEVLPHSLGELGSLRCFWVRFCGHLKSLPDALGKLEALEMLVIEDCSSLEVLPGSIGELRALREFTIRSCGHLKSLPDALGKLEALENLYVEDCKSLEVLPHSLGELGSLRCFWVRFCGHLKSLPDALGKLEALEVFVIEDCNSLEVLPGSIGELRALRQFEIRSCGHLKSLPDAVGTLEALEDLLIDQCNSLELLPHSLGELLTLRKLTILSCGYLKSLPDALGKLVELEYLRIENCSSLQVFPGSIGGLRALQTFSIQRCNDLSSLPDTVGELRALRALRIANCNGLRTLPNTLRELKSLEVLAVESCDNLRDIPNSLGKLQERNIVYRGL